MAPIKTAGAAFDPQERGIMFAAGTCPVVPHNYLIAVNDLSGSGVQKVETLMDDGVRVLIDSGVFNLTNEHKRAHGVHMDEALALAPEHIDGFDDLYKKYVTLAKALGDKSWGYIELDQGGEHNKRRTRARLHDEGLSPIPVYHPLVDSWEYFDELAAGYDRICFGNVVQASSTTRRELLHTLWERKRNYPHLYVHVLGLTANPMSLALPVDSCDSSTWVNGLRYPAAPGGLGYMRRTGTITDRRLFYDRDEEIQGKNNLSHQVPVTDCSRDLAGQVYSDEMIFLNANWSRICDDRANTLGEVRLPALTDKETTL